MSAALDQLLEDLDRVGSLGAAERKQCASRIRWLGIAQDRQIDQLLEALPARAAPPGPAQDELLAAAFNRLVERRRKLAPEAAAQWIADGIVHRLSSLYRSLGGSSQARHHLLRWLAIGRLPAELAAFAELVPEDPPADPEAAAVAFSPLFQQADYDPSPLFPKLFDGLVHPSVAAVIVDLSNFVARKALLPTHPGSRRRQYLADLLGGTVQQLGRLEEHPDEFGQSAEKLSAVIQEAVALAVSLCDALALIGDRAVVGKLYQAMELRHRRLRTEAAAALARLGEKAGRETLLAMADEPVARLRVLTYAEELGLADQVDQRHKTDEARAEAELALWLAQPALFSVPPTACELVDKRTQYWPGYEQPVTCYLFRYTYHFGTFSYSNIGIAGPLNWTFTADLGDLPPDHIYAAFAGWQAEHPEIWEKSSDQLSDQERMELVPLQRRVERAGYELLETVLLGSFVGQKVLVARVKRGAVEGVAVVDDQQVLWFGPGNPLRPLGPDEAYCIYKGRKLLETFNL